MFSIFYCEWNVGCKWMQSCFIHIFHSVPTFFGGEVVESHKKKQQQLGLAYIFTFSGSSI